MYRLIAAIILLGTVSVVAAQKAPLGLDSWEAHRFAVDHPTTSIKAADLVRAHENLARYKWAQDYAAGVKSNAEKIVPLITPEYLATMVDRTTPGGTGPCPACRAKGLPWHPSGQWSWSAGKPDQIVCKVCNTVFPNAEYPESIVLQSTWDPAQKFGYYGGDTFKCFGYNFTRPSFTGIIRGSKLNYVSGQLRTLGRAYALSGDVRFARAARAILLRFSEVLPKYLVRAGYCYGEYADCDPHEAAEHINNLPTDELVYPPNKPDRKLWTGYWSASRVGTSGMDGWWVTDVTETYDLVCTASDGGTPVFTAEERARIERDVLVESAYLAACDDLINNKSVGNRAGAAMVGMCVGYPPLVHFGLEGFRKTVEEWFLPDGGTSESPAYATMTMGGIDGFGLMFRDYSDPAGYVPAEGDERLEDFDACRDTRYGDCWQSLIWSLQGNLRWAPQADSYRTSGLGASNAELIATGYPTPQHLALLRELAGPELAGGSPEQAVFYREPDLATRATEPFVCPDVVFPFLAQGYLRTGATGRDSLALLNAADFGNHHHLDSLDLYYWKDGRELLSDLGYLWDHPDAYQTRKTFSHNTVMIDGTDQRSGGRGGSFTLFATTPQVKAMEASSAAYQKASVYRRTCVQIDHGAAGSYLVDIFRTQGGAQRDYVFHGPNTSYELQGISPAAAAAAGPRALPFIVRLQLGQIGSFQVDGAEVRELLPDRKEGPNLIPAAGAGAPGSHPAGWGFYGGDGKAEWGLAAPGREGGNCVELKGLQEQQEGPTKGNLNVALLLGDSDGYTGTKALAGSPGSKYVVRFWLRGDGATINMDCTSWPADPNSPADRRAQSIKQLAAGDKWTKVEATFALPSSGPPLAKVREAAGDKPWSATWTLEGDYRFSAFVPGSPREQVTVGDGWGQRDHRNTDVGATLPYLVRTCRGGDLDQFVTVFAGGAAGKLPVTAVRTLPLPAGAPADAVAVEIQTVLGTDVVVSMLSPQALTVPTALGPVTTDARLAALLGEGGAPIAACLVGGSRLAVGQTSLATATAALSGKIVDCVSGRGESYYVLDGALDAAAVGQTLLVQDGAFTRAYPLRGLETVGGQLRAYTKRDSVGVEARPATAWQFLPVATWAKG